MLTGQCEDAGTILIRLIEIRGMTSSFHHEREETHTCTDLVDTQK